jgi:uncharacterized protein (DUF952 family)
MPVETVLAGALWRVHADPGTSKRRFPILASMHAIELEPLAERPPGPRHGVLFEPRQAEHLQVKVTIIYKIVTADEWRQAKRAGSYVGSAVDDRDGFIHFSGRNQVVETAAKHFAGQPDLLLVAVQSGRLDFPLRWEASRNGALFPHLYGPLLLSAVTSVTPLPLDQHGRHIFPELER